MNWFSKFMAKGKIAVGDRLRVTKARRDQLAHKYGLTPEAYLALLDTQSGKCKICGKEGEGAKGKSMSVDHDHTTGRIRGLLCTKCNVMLGNCEDNPTILLRAIQYLKGNL